MTVKETELRGAASAKALSWHANRFGRRRVFREQAITATATRTPASLRQRLDAT
jgi:hypothetical protein